MQLPADKAMILQYTFTATAVEVTPNAQGRVIIPQALREFAQIEGEALVIGMNNRVEIWNKAKFEEFTAAHQDTLTESGFNAEILRRLFYGIFSCSCAP